MLYAMTLEEMRHGTEVGDIHHAAAHEDLVDLGPSGFGKGDDLIWIVWGRQ